MINESSASREKILSKVRKALINKSDADFSEVDFESAIFPKPEEPLDILFAQKLTALNGKFIFCEKEKELGLTIKALIEQNNWSNIFCLEEKIKTLLKNEKIAFIDSESDFLKTNIGITFCECIVARTGSVLITSKQLSGRRLPVYSNMHLVIAYTSQLVYNIKDGLNFIQKKYHNQLPSMIANITGPSRTADIEKTLVQGAHGPKEIYVVLVDDSPKS